MIKKEIKVHFQCVDPLYFSLVDIIDSILPESYPQLIPDSYALKNDLYSTLRPITISSSQFMSNFSFPNIPLEKKNAFIDFLTSVVLANTKLSEFSRINLKAILQAGKKLESLVFLGGNIENTLLESFAGFYRDRIITLSMSNHIFDSEEQIKNGLSRISLIENGIPLRNFKFVDSKNDPLIQLSDIFVGFTGKLINHILAQTSQDHYSFMRELDDEQRDTLQKYFHLIDKSNSVFGGSFKWVCASDTRQKFWETKSCLK